MLGKLIVVEGTDCSGKETQSKLLVKKLNDMGIKAVQFAFPNYNSATGKIIAGPYLGKEGYLPPLFEEGAINVDPYCSSLLYAMDRKYNIGLIQEKLNQGYNVVLDRYVSSNLAHHGAKLNGDERKEFFDFVETLEYNLLKLPKPDLQIFLHMPTWATCILKKDREEKPDQHEANEAYLKKAESVYIEIANRQKFFTILCAENNHIKSVEEINSDVVNYVVNFIKK